MREYLQFYIDGAWVDPIDKSKTLDVINPANEEPFARIAMGSAADVDLAVKAARKAFPAFSRTSKEERLALLQKIIEVYMSRMPDLMSTITEEMGAPQWLAQAAQAPAGLAHLAKITEVLGGFEFTEQRGSTLIAHEAVGVCGFITPWNWPINQIVCKVAPALAAGCTMVLKPSEIAPIDAQVFAQILHEAGVPKGVFNLVNGDGPTVGQAIATHPGVDMVSFTGSTRAGIAVAKAAADTVKRVHQELGGKSANIILDDADVAAAVSGGVRSCFMNSGQSCNAPTRMFVPRAKQAEAITAAKAAAEATIVGNPNTDGVTIGPVVSKTQYDKIQRLIEAGIKEGAKLVAGGAGRPKGCERGYYVQPTVFADVTNEMTIAREEIFGPVLAILPYDTEAQAIEMANDTVYGLSGYVSSGTVKHAKEVADQLRTGNVHLNGAGPDFGAPFGGFKQSGNGREWGEFGFREFLEVKAVLGYDG
ncbi:MAG TPA: aldehyde dehydrogenase family protein [Candidatus Binatia bacterium]|jgi:aldehyde dehydrogenase (NAD+)|nr:aldehyde dehydrogenase family protein [Candidatus Binatia bacterium]